MDIPREFVGKVYFHFSTTGQFVMAATFSDAGDGWVKLGESDEISVTFHDARKEMADSLQKQIEQERADSQRRIAIMQGKIQELLALEVVK